MFVLLNSCILHRQRCTAVVGDVELPLCCCNLKIERFLTWILFARYWKNILEIYFGNTAWKISGKLYEFGLKYWKTKQQKQTQANQTKNQTKPLQIPQTNKQNPTKKNNYTDTSLSRN